MKKQASVIWVLGRPASGKTTLARRMVQLLRERKRRAALLDSDEVRQAITPDPEYTRIERQIVYRALALTAEKLAENGVIAVVSATAHRREQRRWARQICGRLAFVQACCSVSTCRSRDPKGLYQAAEMDPDNRLPGVGEPWEEPEGAIPIDTEEPVSDTDLKRLFRQLGY